MRREEDAATFTLAATWKFGPEKQTEWAYTTEGTAAADGDDWKIRWNPATVAPGPGRGPLSYSTLAPQPAARVLDRTGAELLTQHIVTLVDIAPGVDVNAVAALLNPIAPTITADSLAGRPRRRQAGHGHHPARGGPDPDRRAAGGACRT